MTVPGSALSLLTSGAAGGYEIERSLRFNSADSAYLNRTPSVEGNRTTWTWSSWVKRSKSTSSDLQVLFASGPENDDFSLAFDTDDRLAFYEWDGGFTWRKKTDQVFRDFSAWYHVVAVLDTSNATEEDRARLYVNGVRITSWNVDSDPSLNFSTTQINAVQEHRIGQTTANPIRYIDGYLADVHFIDGQALDQYSFGEFDSNGVWQPKAYTGSYGTNGFHLPFSDNSSNAALGFDSSPNGNDWTVNNITTNANRYAIGKTVPYGSYGTSNPYILLNSATAPLSGTSFPTDGTYLSHAQTSSPFNSDVIQFSPAIASTGTVYLYALRQSNGGDIKVNVGYPSEATITVSTSSWSYHNTGVSTLYNIQFLAGAGGADILSALQFVSTTSDTTGRLSSSPPQDQDSLVDSPTNGTQTDTGVGGEVVGNYATLNPLHTTGINAGTGAAVLSNGNLEATSNTSAYKNNFGTIVFPAAGKYYFEVTVLSNNGTNNQTAGIAAIEGTTRKYLLDCFATSSTSKRSLVDSSATSLSGSFNVGDVIGVAVDCDAGTAVIKHNNIDIDSGYTLASGVTYAPFFSGYNCGTSAFNFGQRAWVYSAPSNHKSLCTTNLPDPTIADGSTAMDVALWTGNGSTQTISGLNFSPDLVWVKARSTAISHFLYDTVRGFSNGNALELRSNQTNAEGVPGTANTGLTAFNSDGFSLGSDGGANTSSATYVGWTWDAGSSTVTNTDGSIPSQVRANPSAGFSVVTYTGNGTSGATVGHGLGVKPDFLIVKNRDQTVNWVCYHKNIGATKFLPLNLTNAETAWSGFLNNTEPSSSVVTLGNGTGPNGSGDDILIYAFTGVDGYSSFGSYTGNGSTDGPFVYTGFRPRWLMVKETTNSNPWFLLDATRSTYNYVGDTLWPNLSNRENDTSINPNTTYNNFDFLSNGFKLRSQYSGTNRSSGNYIYAAFAESPFQYARAR